VDDDAFLPLRRARFFKTGQGAVFIHHIDITKDCTDFLCHLLARLRVHIKDCNLYAGAA